jgi:DNA-binding response OmpR family regulator
VDCYLTKPFQPQELINFVQRVLDSSGGTNNYGDGQTVYKI